MLVTLEHRLSQRLCQRRNGFSTGLGGGGGVAGARFMGLGRRQKLPTMVRWCRVAPGGAETKN
jgi:hypothetical protein